MTSEQLPLSVELDEAGPVPESLDGPHISERIEQRRRQRVALADLAASTLFDPITERTPRPPSPEVAALLDEHDGRSRRDDISAMTDLDGAALEVEKFSPDWVVIARACNLTEWTGDMHEDGAHVEARQSEGLGHLRPTTSHVATYTDRPGWRVSAAHPDGRTHSRTFRNHADALQAVAKANAAGWQPVIESEAVEWRKLAPAMRPFYSRPPVEFPHHLSIHQRDGGDQAIIAVTVPEHQRPALDADGERTVHPAHYAVQVERQHVDPSKRSVHSLWAQLKHSGGNGPKLRKGSWVWNPVRVIECSTEDDAQDAAWRWAGEIDAHRDDLLADVPEDAYVVA